MKVLKKTITIEVCKLVPDRDTTSEITFGDEVAETLEQVAAELIGAGHVVEAYTGD